MDAARFFEETDTVPIKTAKPFRLEREEAQASAERGAKLVENREHADKHGGPGDGTAVEGRHYRTGEPVRLRLEGGAIAAVERLERHDGGEEEALPLIGPGLVDLQVNGFAGIDFNTAGVTADDVVRVTQLLWGEGVTSYYPTVITNGEEAIAASLRAIADACAANTLTAGSIPGIHLEGPYISPEDGARGAHSAAYVKAPDWEQFRRWQDAAAGRIRLVTLSPEWEEAPAFIEKCAASGVTVSIGHTAATSQQIREAVAAGATMSTHLGNGSHLMLPRHANYIYEQLAHDELAAMVIADGFHLPASVLKVFYRAKREKFMLVSDAVYISGLAPGEYETHIGGRVRLTPEGRLHVADRPEILAGSAQMLTAGIAHLVRLGLCPPEEAWELASLRPAAAIRLPAAEGLSAGAPADLVVHEWEAGKPVIRRVYKNGDCVFRAISR